MINRRGGEVVVVIMSVTGRMYILYFWENIEDKTDGDEGKRENNWRKKRK